MQEKAVDVCEIDPAGTHSVHELVLQCTFGLADDVINSKFWNVCFCRK